MKPELEELAITHQIRQIYAAALLLQMILQRERYVMVSIHEVRLLQASFKLVLNFQRIALMDLKEKHEIYKQFLDTPDVMTCVLLLSSLLSIARQLHNEYIAKQQLNEIKSFNVVNLPKDMNVLELTRTIQYVLCVEIAKSCAGNVICPGYNNTTII
ncbi:MAG: hypothetical protein EZS28_002705 [Streblomastix strix]|uniref:Uncharacterized protein n=1 Tax=Streblomastix strix TaxID=222440 RepID=A0A5J4X469_9EUKA|nr:MAG: hypothetical protein EZS28_002705 [Streblomastix strix]